MIYADIDLLDSGRWESVGRSLDLHHEILLHILEGKIHLAPVENPAAILDIGTGTGIWAIDASEKFPDAKVTGTDIRFALATPYRTERILLMCSTSSPIQPGWYGCSLSADLRGG